MRNRYEIRGELAFVAVNRRSGPPVQFIVDAAMIERVAELSWGINSNGYIRSTQKRGKVYVHRHVAGAACGTVVDHINHDKLDNRLANLRVTNGTINGLNRKSTPDNVYWLPRVGLYLVRFQVHGKPRIYGQFASVEDARAVASEIRERLLAGELPPPVRQPPRVNSGVSFNRASGRWYARPFINGRRVALGYFDTKRLALEAVRQATAAA